MRFWREIVNDRWSGGVVGALLSLVFVFQLALAGEAAAAMHAPASVICSTAPDGSHRPPAKHDNRRECPCAELCGAGAPVSSLAPPPDAGGVPIRFADRAPVASDPRPRALPRLLVRHQPARGPPAFVAS